MQAALPRFEIQRLEGFLGAGVKAINSILLLFWWSLTSVFYLVWLELFEKEKKSWRSYALMV